MNKTPKKLHKPENHSALVKKFRLFEGDFKYNKEMTAIPNRRNRMDTGLETYQGTWSDTEMAHLLKRTLFGPSKADLSLFRSIQFSEAVNTLLTPVPLLPPPVNNYNGVIEGLVDPDTPFGETWIEAPYNNEIEGGKILSLKGWILKNMLNSPTSLHHKMTFFWHNLLVTQFWDVFQAKASYQYYKLLHESAFGNFRSLIKAVTKDPAMLIYLNGTRNNKEAPDENYARELQELFCVGKGPNSNYTEGDVQAAARVLTGWVVDADSIFGPGEARSFFFPGFHEESDKTFSAFYENRIVAGRSGTAGEEELDDLIDLIFDNDETALYICRRLYNFFIYNETDETTEEQVIAPLAQIFRDNDYEILPVLTALLNSAHFHDQSNYGVLIKNPMDHLFGLVRTLDLVLADGSDLTEEFLTFNALSYHTSRLGLEVGDPPSVAGWPAYYQEPQFDQSWITTDSITRRAEVSDVIVQYAFFANAELFYETDLVRWLQSFDNPADPNEMLQEAALLLHGIALGDNSFETIKSILLGGQEGDHHWTLAWNAFLRDPEDPELRSVVENRLKATFVAFMQQGEFHLM